jgi:hypothetical protein
MMSEHDKNLKEKKEEEKKRLDSHQSELGF